jgi:histidinol-phosphate aminotransferase
MNPLLRPAVDRIHGYVPGEQPSGSNVLKLNTNENPYPPSPACLKALSSITPDVLRKYPHPVAAELRQAIADLHGLGASQVIVTNGSDEALALCTRAFAPLRGSAGWLSPSYSLYPVLAEIAELRPVEFPLDADFRWEVPPRIDVDLFFLTNPNAPTSIGLDNKVLRSAARACRGIIIVDEAYVDFADASAVPLLRECPNLIVSRTFSKSYSLAGLRMGYLLGAPELIEALGKIKDSYNTDAVAQRVALAALRDDSWMRQNALSIRRTRQSTTEKLTRLGFSVLPSQTNFVFAQVPAGQDAQRLFERLRDQQVYVRYFPGPRTGTYLRITIGSDAQMDRFFEALAAC